MAEGQTGGGTNTWSLTDNTTASGSTEGGVPNIVEKDMTAFKTKTGLIKDMGPWIGMFWFGEGVLSECCGKAIYMATKGIAYLSFVVAVTNGAYDVVTQDNLWGSNTLPTLVPDLMFIFIQFASGIYIDSRADRIHRHGMTIVDPSMHIVLFLRFVFDIVFLVCLAISAGSPGFINFGPGAASSYPGTNLHQGMYIFLLVLVGLEVVTHLWRIFATWAYNGPHVYREGAWAAYRQYYWRHHIHGAVKFNRQVQFSANMSTNMPARAYGGPASSLLSQQQPLLLTPQQQQLAQLQLQQMQQQQQTMIPISVGAGQTQGQGSR